MSSAFCSAYLTCQQTGEQREILKPEGTHQLTCIDDLSDEMTNCLPILPNVFSIKVYLCNTLASRQMKGTTKRNLLCLATLQAQQESALELLGFEETTLQLKTKEGLTCLSDGKLIYRVTHVIDVTSATSVPQRLFPWPSPQPSGGFLLFLHHHPCSCSIE